MHVSQQNRKYFFIKIIAIKTYFRDDALFTLANTQGSAAIAFLRGRPPAIYTEQSRFSRFTIAVSVRRRFTKHVDYHNSQPSCFSYENPLTRSINPGAIIDSRNTQENAGRRNSRCWKYPSVSNILESSSSFRHYSLVTCDLLQSLAIGRKNRAIDKATIDIAERSANRNT